MLPKLTFVMGAGLTQAMGAGLGVILGFGFLARSSRSGRDVLCLLDAGFKSPRSRLDSDNRY